MQYYAILEVELQVSLRLYIVTLKIHGVRLNRMFTAPCYSMHFEKYTTL